MNVKDEFLDFKDGKPFIKAVYISVSRWNENYDSKLEEFRWSNDDCGNSVGNFLKQIDISFYINNGTDMHIGIIWFTDGTWAEWEVGGESYCWVHKLPPLQKDYGFNK